MDDDRQMINKHLEITDNNNHNLITNMNQQIQWNQNFNTYINKLLNTVKMDRETIRNFIKTKTDNILQKITIWHQINNAGNR